jgi:hypothetical protein
MSGEKASERFIALVAVEEHGEYYDEHAEWLPLEVWASRGYNKDAIEAKARPEDKRQHPVLGDVYRVSILQTGNRGVRGTKKTDTLSAASSSGGPAAITGGSAPVLALADKSDSSSGNSSDSSSSSRHKKKSKKGKKGKKGKKEKKEKKEKNGKRPRNCEGKASVSSSASCW